MAGKYQSLHKNNLQNNVNGILWSKRALCKVVQRGWPSSYFDKWPVDFSGNNAMAATICTKFPMAGQIDNRVGVQTSSSYNKKLVWQYWVLSLGW
jgi:hypothetical protein